MLFVRIPTPEFRHVGDRYGDLIQEAIENLRLEFDDVTFITPDEDPHPAACARGRRIRAFFFHARSRRTPMAALRASFLRGPAAVALRLVHRRAAQSPLHLRRLRLRPRQPVRARRRHGRRRVALQGLQPALPLRRRGHGQDPPDARHRPRGEAAPARRVHLLRLRGEVHQRDDQLRPLRQDDQLPRQASAPWTCCSSTTSSSSRRKSAPRRSSSTPSTRCTTT